MLPEELKSIEYNFTDRTFILYFNGIEKWRRTRSEFANSITESGSFDIYTIRVKVENGEFLFGIYPKFKNQTVKLVGPLKFDEKNQNYTLSDEKRTDWFIGIKRRIKSESEFGTLKEKAILDKLIDGHKRTIIEYKHKIKEFEDKIKEHENIITLLEKFRNDKEWK